MSTDSEVRAHYSSGNLLARLNAVLAEDGIDPEHPSLEALGRPTTSFTAAVWKRR